MKASILLLALSAAAIGSAQETPPGSPAGMSSSTRMADQAIAQAMAAMKAGKKVTITVDNRSINYAPRTFNKMLYVPVRFFTETGQKVVWERGARRATITDENGPSKNSVEYDTSPASKTPPMMRPTLQKGTFYVPLASGLASFGLLAEWVPTSNRINVRSVRPSTP